MPPELREALRGLCCAHGWSYGALWRPDRLDPWLLMMEECYYEEQVRSVIDKMRDQAHMVGVGTLGVASISGKHQWIYNDSCIDSSPTRTVDNFNTFQSTHEWGHQFVAGIKTIAIISLPSFGVGQFGSFQKIPQSLNLVDQVQHFLRTLETVTGLRLHSDARRSMNAPAPSAAFTPATSSGDTYSNNDSDINISHAVIDKVHLHNAQFSTAPIQTSGFFSLGSHNDKFQGADTEPQALLPPNSLLRSSYTPDSSLGNYLNTIKWTRDIATDEPMMEQRLSSCMAVRGSPGELSTESHYSIPHINTSPHFDGKSCEGWSSRISQPCCYGDLTTSISFHIAPSFAPDHPDYLITPQELTSVHSKDDRLNDPSHLIDQPSEHLSDALTVPVNDDMLGVSCVSSGLVGSDASGCSLMTKLPCRLAENSLERAMNSLATGFDWRTNSSNTPTMLLSETDPFDGMELDLSRRILNQDTWGDIIMPVGSGTCSNLSTSVADCIDVGSIEDYGKGLFSDSTLEQLLDAVVAGTVDLSSSHNSIATDVNSVVSLGSQHHSSTVTKSGSPQMYGNQVPLLVHPSLLPTADMSLPNRSLEKIMQGSPKEALLKSHVSSWIDDSCSMIDARAVTDQRKKPEEPAKVAKRRARPGESTRPRPKDRQQIQDRVKELREIVPNGAKCSIDSLLDRTIKHMLFLQSVAKYADKLKQADEPKMIGDDTGVVLKDSLTGGGGGATWAYEVAGQTMVCPILVEDLNPPGQMLVEMLCDDRGFFLEIADIIRGFGLNILKGVMENRDSKIWARFLVEANRDVTRMDIFLSLVQLLQQASCIRSSDLSTKIIDKGVNAFSNYNQSPSSTPISLADGLH